MLDVSSSSIDDLDALAISIMLNQQIGKLEILDISSNQIGDEGFVSLLSALQWHPNLRELHAGEFKP